MLEDETNATANEMQVLFHEKILPDLSNNIICGNSLVDTDILTQKLFSIEEERNINPLNLGEAFKSIMQCGGFDAVVGNPPYVDSEEMVKSSPVTRGYCAEKYQTAKGNWDLYCVFTERAISLLNQNGRLGYIIPNKFLSVPYGEHLRRYCSRYSVKELVDYSAVGVFKSNGVKINVYPVLLIINKSENDRAGVYTKMTESDYISVLYKKDFIINNHDVDWTEKFELIESLILKVRRNSVDLSKHFIAENAASVAEAYIIQGFIKDENTLLKETFKFVNTGTIDRYADLWGRVSTRYIKKSYNKPTINRSLLKNELPRRYSQAISEKLILAGMVRSIEAIYDNGQMLAGKSTVIILNRSSKYSLKYLLAIINSRLFSTIYFSLNKHKAMAGGYLNINTDSLVRMPIKELDFELENDRGMYNNLVGLVDSLHDTIHLLISSRTDKDKSYYNRRCREIDSQIDSLVYELYGLTEEEIKVVEESFN